jgi:hypothetical protein
MLLLPLIAEPGSSVFSEMRVAQESRMEIELAFRRGEIGMAGRDEGADPSDTKCERELQQVELSAGWLN